MSAITTAPHKQEPKEPVPVARRFFRHALGDIANFSRVLVGRPLRPYQLEVARAIVASVRKKRGATFTVEMARQMGKNEVSAQVEAYLLLLHQFKGGTIVKCAPTQSPQVLVSKLRLEEVLRSPWLAPYVKRSAGNVVEVGNARAMFYSAHEQANVVGATASLLLEVDEAQDVDAEKFTKEFLPMASAHNATVVLYGTPWTQDTLLAQEKTRTLAYQARSGERRHFSFPWQVGAAANPWYARAVEAQIAQRGREDVIIRTQYFLEEVDDAAAFFTAEMQQALSGDHPRLHAPLPQETYVAAVDVAGEDSAGAGALANPQQDSTVVLIGALEWRTDPLLGLALPGIRIVNAYQWTGLPTTEQYARLVRLLGETWRVQRAVVDATGIGDALARFLAARLGSSRVDPFVFTAQSKSALGYDLWLLAGSGRLRMWADDGSGAYRAFWEQVRLCRRELRPGRQLGFSVPPHLGHDDYVMALALLTRMEEQATPPDAAVLVRPQAEAAGNY